MSEAPERVWIDLGPGSYILGGYLASPPRVEYVRADIAEDLRAENERLTAELHNRINWWSEEYSKVSARALSAEACAEKAAEALEMARHELWEMGASESEHNALWHVRRALPVEGSKDG